MNSLEVLSLGMDIFQAFTIQLFLRGYFEEEKVKKYLIASIWILYIIFSNLIISYSLIPVLNLFFTIIFYFTILIIVFKASYKNGALMAIFLLAMGMISEVSIAILSSALLNVETTNILGSQRYVIVASIYSKIVLFVLLRICFLLSRQKRDKLLSNLNWIMVVVIPFGSTWLIYNTVLAGELNMMNKISLHDVISILIILIINLFVFYLYDKIMEDVDLKLQNQLYEQQAAYYVRQYQDNEQSNFEVRQIKHDMKNQFILLQEYVEHGESNKLMEHIKSVLKDKNSDRNYAQSKNLQIDSVLNYKIDYAKQYNIDFDLQIEVPNKLFVQEMDLCVILGNALDNAIEACLKLPIEDRLIKVILKYTNETLYIATMNSMLENDIVKENNHPVTTKKDKKQHGIGLKSIEKVISKYNGCMEIKDVSNQKFQLELFLYKI